MMTGVLLATGAGSTIFFGLTLARWRGASERLRLVFAAGMTAIALGFLLGFIAELVVGSAYAHGG